MVMIFFYMGYSAPIVLDYLGNTVISIFIIRFLSRYSIFFGVFEDHYNLLYGLYFYINKDWQN